MLMATEATGSAEMERGAKHMNMSMRMSCHTVYRNYRLDSTRARKDPYASTFERLLRSSLLGM